MKAWEEMIKSVSYKIAEISNGNGETLQTLLEKALDISKKAVDRFQDATHSEESKLFINNHSNQSSMICGTFCLFEKGKHQPVFEYDNTLNSFPIDTIAPPEKDKAGLKKRQEFLESMLYFGIYENHVILVQSLSLRAITFENYLNRFLKDKTKLLADNASVYLKDQLSPEQLENVNKAKGLKMFSHIEFDEQVISDGTKECSVKPKGHIWEAIKTFIGDNNPILPNGLNLNDAIKEGQIEAVMELKWKNKRSDDDTPLLDQIATVLRNSEDIDYCIDMGKYGTLTKHLTKSEFKLNKSINVAIVNGSPNEYDIYRKMNEWLLELIKSRRVFGKI